MRGETSRDETRERKRNTRQGRKGIGRDWVRQIEIGRATEKDKERQGETKRDSKRRDKDRQGETRGEMGRKRVKWRDRE